MRSVRIIAGNWRSRKISFLDLPHIRPTPNRIRETLFNWLSPIIAGANCLDAFAGSGALGFEALSRGAKSVTMIESSLETVKVLKKNAETLNAENLEIIHGFFPEVLSHINHKKFDIVFLDPPFHQNLILPAANYLQNNHYLTASSYVYIETERHVQLQLPDNWKVFRHKQTGEVEYSLVLID